MPQYQFVKILKISYHNCVVLWISQLSVILPENQTSRDLTSIVTESPEPSEGSDNEKSDCYEEEPRWAVMPVKFGKILDFLGHLSSSVDIFSR